MTAEQPEPRLAETELRDLAASVGFGWDTVQRLRTTKGGGCAPDHWCVVAPCDVGGPRGSTSPLRAGTQLVGAARARHAWHAADAESTRRQWTRFCHDAGIQSPERRWRRHHQFWEGGGIEHPRHWLEDRQEELSRWCAAHQSWRLAYEQGSPVFDAEVARRASEIRHPDQDVACEVGRLSLLLEHQLCTDAEDLSDLEAIQLFMAAPIDVTGAMRISRADVFAQRCGRPWELALYCAGEVLLNCWTAAERLSRITDVHISAARDCWRAALGIGGRADRYCRDFPVLAAAGIANNVRIELVS